MLEVKCRQTLYAVVLLQAEMHSQWFIFEFAKWLGGPLLCLVSLPGWMLSTILPTFHVQQSQSPRQKDLAWGGIYICKWTEPGLSFKACGVYQVFLAENVWHFMAENPPRHVGRETTEEKEKLLFHPLPSEQEPCAFILCLAPQTAWQAWCWSCDGNFSRPRVGGSKYDQCMIHMYGHVRMSTN